jgi:3-oxoacyl-[acyl-carrier-protein] synthase II
MADRSSSVAVTGIGVVSPLGVGRERFWAALCAGESGIAPRERAGGLPAVAARVRDFDARRFVRSNHLRRMDGLSRMIVAAGRMAIDDASSTLERLAPERLGVVVGSAIGNVSESAAYQERLWQKGPALASPMTFPNLVLNAPASYLAMDLGATGVNFTVAQGETSGEAAIALGVELVRAGRADVVLAGGGDELGAIMVRTYRAGKVLSGQHGGAEWCSPYDAERNGIVLGEGAAMLTLESPARARARGAAIYAEIDAAAAFSLPSPLYDWPSRIVAVPPPLRQLLDGARPGLVCGGANSSKLLDACEAELVTHLLGEGAAAATITSIKGAVGELGAAGALTTAAACLAVRQQTIPPLCHLRRPLPGTPLRFAARRAAPEPLDRVLVLGLARGGAGAALSLRRAE